MYVKKTKMECHIKKSIRVTSFVTKKGNMVYNLFVAWLVWCLVQVWHQIGFEVADSGLEMAVAALPLVCPHCHLSPRLALYFPYSKAEGETEM